jgi:hypothetical protein
MKKSKYFLDYLNLKKIKYELCRPPRFWSSLISSSNEWVWL